MSLNLPALTGANTILQLVYDLNQIKVLAANTTSPVFSTSLKVNGFAQLGSTTDGVVIENNSGAFSIGNAAYIRRNNSTGDLEIYASSNASRNLIFGSSSGAEDMRIDSNGNLGLGISPATNHGFTRIIHASGSYSALTLASTSSRTFTLGSGDASFQIWDTTAGSERMRIDSSGNLLVGTTSTVSGTSHVMTGDGLTLQGSNPSAQWYISGNSLNEKYWRILAQGTTLAYQTVDDAYSSGPSYYVVTRSGNGVTTHQWFTSGSERMRIDSNGNLGIGSSSIPSNVRAQVIGTNRALVADDTANLLVGTSDAMTDNYGGSIGFQHGGSTGAMIAAIKAGRQSGTTNGGYLSFATRTDAAFATERMRIDSSGQVGIGTSTVKSKMDIYLDGSGSIGTLAQTHLALKGGAQASDVSLIGAGYIDDTATYAPIAFGALTTDNNGYTKAAFIIATRDATTDSQPTEKVRIDSSGQVGIGTTAPSGSLHISSTFPTLYLTDTDTSVDHRISGGSGSGLLYIDCDLNAEGSNPAMVFGVAGSEKLRLTSTGALQVGTTAAQVGGSEKLTILSTTSGEFGLAVKVAADGVGLGLWQPGDNSSARTIQTMYGRSGASLNAVLRWTTSDHFNIVTSSGTDITFTPGTGGYVGFGTHTGIGAETVTGYITVKDSSGTLRKLAVVS